MGECEGSAAAGFWSVLLRNIILNAPAHSLAGLGGFGRNARLAGPVCGGTEGAPHPGLSRTIGPRAGALSRPGTRPSLCEMTVRPEPTTLDSLGGKT